MLTISKAQVDALVVSNRRLLASAIADFLAESCPDAIEWLPPDKLRSLIDASIELGLSLGIDDEVMLRVFVRLRLTISPSFYQQPEIAAVLANRGLTAQQRFERLASKGFERAWEAARLQARASGGADGQRVAP
jgi:hypothetical protein